MSFTPKQARFVEEYLIDLNATQAAVRAGYSERTAEQQGYQLLQKTSVREAIAEAMQERSKRTEIDQDWLVEQSKEILRRAMTPIRARDRYGKPTGPEMRQLGAANTAIFNIAKLTGHWVDKRADAPPNLAEELFLAIGARPLKLIEHENDA